MGTNLPSVYDFTAREASGSVRSLADYRGKVVLIVNTASKCGFTPQYEGLERLYRDLQGRGLAILAFPCNQFNKQEPGDAEEIRSFCALFYDVSFPVFAKTDVNGPHESPLFAWLKSEAPGVLGTRSIKWNFTKFLIGRDGSTVRRYAPSTKPDEIRADIEAMLDI